MKIFFDFLIVCSFIFYFFTNYVFNDTSSLFISVSVLCTGLTQEFPWWEINNICWSATNISNSSSNNNKENSNRGFEGREEKIYTNTSFSLPFLFYVWVLFFVAWNNGNNKNNDKDYLLIIIELVLVCT